MIREFLSGPLFSVETVFPFEKKKLTILLFQCMGMFDIYYPVTMTLDQPVLALTLWHEVSVMIATKLSVFMSLIEQQGSTDKTTGEQS